MAGAQDLLLAKYALRTSLLDHEVLQDCLREQQQLRATGQRLPLIQILVRRRIVAAESLAPIIKAIESTSFDCLRCRSRWPFAVLSAAEQLACPNCRGPLKILQEDGETLSERLTTGRRTGRHQPLPGQVADTRPDTTTARLADSDRPTLVAPPPRAEIPRPSPAAETWRARLARDGVPETFGPYEILGELGRGGMGVVYKARQPALDRIVALKVLIAGDMASRTQVMRFQREAELAAKLKHPGIVGIHDVGQIGDRHYFTMDYVDGKPLSDRIKLRDLGLRAGVEIARDIARALAHAHSHGVIHRDVKPANIIVDTEGRPHLTDFGLAREAEVDESSVRLTRDGAAVGTPFYMSPEQARGDRKSIGPPSDVYSLGVVLFEMLTFELPFSAKTQLELTRKILTEAPPRPTSIEPAIDMDVETILLKTLEKDPGERYASAAELADDLDRYLNGEPITARPATFGARLRGRLRHHRRKVLPASVALLTALVATGASYAVYGKLKELDRLKALDEQRRRELAEVEKQKRSTDDVSKRRDDSDRALRDAQAAFDEADRVPGAAKEAFAEKLLQTIQLATTAIERDATNARAFLLRGRAREILRQLAEAQSDYADAAKLDPSGLVGAEGAYRDGRLYLRNRRNETEARSRLEKLAKSEKTSVWSCLARASLALIDDAKPNEVLSHVEAARQMDNTCAEVYYVTAIVQSNIGGPRETLEPLDHCLEIERKDARLYALRARVRLATGKLDLALEDLRRAFALDPDEPFALLTQAELKTQRGEFRDALLDIQKILAAQHPNEDPAVLVSSIGLHGLADDVLGAQRAAERACELIPGSPEPYMALAKVYGGRDLFDLAVKELRRGLEACRSPRAQQALARDMTECLRAANRLGELEEFLKQRLADAPAEPPRKLKLANFYAMQGTPESFEKAVALYEEIHQLSPTYVEAYEGHLNVLLETGKKKEFDALIRRLLEAAPRDGDAFATAAMAYAMTDRNEEAFKTARAGLEVDASNPDLNSKLALLELNANDLKNAARHARAALARSPKNARALTVLGVVSLQEKGPSQEALDYFQSALEVDPGEVDAAYFVASMLYSDGKPQTALRVAEVALRRGAARAPGKLFEVAGACHLALNRPRDAERLLRIAVERAPTNPRSHVALAEALLALEQPAAAEAALNRALELDPDSDAAKRLKSKFRNR